MQQIKIPSETLLEKLKENRHKHETDYLKAVEGFQEDLLQTLSALLKKAKTKVEDVPLFIPLEKPVSYLKEYDKVIQMLELTEETHVVLSSIEFSHFVLDDWHWKQQFAISTAKYLGK